jgi:hypothetical protein
MIAAFLSAGVFVAVPITGKAVMGHFGLAVSALAAMKSQEQSDLRLGVAR